MSESRDQVLKAKSFDDPDEVMDFPNGHADVVRVGGLTLLSVRFDPGFRWSRDMAPTAGTEACMTRHILHVMSGRMGLRLSDGTETELGPGGVALVAPGHDSWTVGNVPCLWFDYDPER